MNQKIQQIKTPSDAAALFRAAMPKEQREERVFVLPLDGNGKVLAKPILVSVGHTDGTTTIDAGAVFREALKAGAEEIIVAHNHPSGDLTPSKADIAATAELKDLASRLKVDLVDHLIVGSSEHDYVSFAEKGFLCNESAAKPTALVGSRVSRDRGRVGRASLPNFATGFHVKLRQ